MRVGRAIGAGALAAALWVLTSLLPWALSGGRYVAAVVLSAVPGPLRSLSATPVVVAVVVVAVGALLVGAVVAGAALLIRGRARFPVVWLAVIVAVLLAAAAMLVGQLIGLGPRPGALFARFEVPQLLGAALWGLVVGWGPALVAVPPPRPSPSATMPPSSTPPSGAFAFAYPVATTDCPDGALVLDASGGGAATGHREHDLQIRNTAGVSCTITGYPGVALTGAQGRLTAATVRPGSSFMVQDPGPMPVTLAPGRTAVASIGWDAGAEPDDPTTSRGVALAIAQGSPTLISPADALDIVDGTTVTVTAWHAGALDPEGP